MAHIEVEEESIEALPELAAISIGFQVRSILEVELESAGVGGMRLVERVLDEPYWKDYDVDAGEGPSRLASRFDVSRWGVIGAWSGGSRVGSAVIAWNSPKLHMLEERRDLAVLWDLRVQPESRGRGVGTALMRRVEEWVVRQGGTTLKVETQSTNVPALRFYVSMGFTLGGLNRFAYPAFPHETQLLWYKSLHSRSHSRSHSPSPSRSPQS
jgi:ribosomal protein S18 acetylase RimI-like enzyme